MKTNHEYHIELWGELAITGGVDKSEVFSKLSLPEVSDDCFACSEAGWEACEYCPIDWNSRFGFDDDVDDIATCQSCYFSPFEWWANEENVERRKEYAKHIAGMEWVETIHEL